MVPHDPLAALKVRQLEALADGIMDAGLTSVRELARPAAQQSEAEVLRQRQKISRSLDALESLQSQGRQVGVISHVDAMKERIPTRISVNKQGGGKSAIEVYLN